MSKSPRVVGEVEKLMENRTGRKIKVLHYDHVEEYKDSFL